MLLSVRDELREELTFTTKSIQVNDRQSNTIYLIHEADGMTITIFISAKRSLL